MAERTSRASFFVTVWFRVDGAPDIRRLRRAIRASVARHPALRTGFVPDATDNFRAVVHARARFGFHRAPIATATHETVGAACAPFLGKVTDFADPGALQHYCVLDVATGGSVIVISQHHAISDGKSVDNFVADLARAYNGAPPVHAAPARPADPAPDEAAATTWFRDLLADVEAVPRLHRDLAGPRQLAREETIITADQTARLHRLAGDSSLFSVLAAAFAIEIGATTGADDVTFSFQSDGRRAGTPAIGSFSNALPLRVVIAPDESLAALARRIRPLIQGAVRHEALPYHRIQQLTGVAPDFSLNLYPAPPPISLRGLTVGPREFLPSDADYAINLRWQLRRGGDRPSYAGEAYFNAGEISRARVAAFNHRYTRLLGVALADPEATVADLLARRREQAPSATVSPAAPLPVPPPRRIFRLVQQAAERSPDRPAIMHPGGTLSYRALWTRVERRAAALAGAGVRPGQTIAFLADRNVDFVITMLALSRVGAAFAVLDAEYPDARLLELVTSLTPDRVIVATPELEPRLRAFADGGFSTLRPVVRDDLPPAPLPPPATAMECAYFLFTSGTTGRPRVVGTGHGALPAFLAWERQELAIRADDRVSLLSGLAHDPVLRDVFLPLSTGATLCIPPPAAIRDPRALIAWLGENAISIMHTTPPMGQLLCEVAAGAPVLPALRAICWGGDALGQGLVNRFNDANARLRQINFYGATETPQAVAFHDVGRGARDRAVVPIGRAISCTRVRVVDGAGRPLGMGETGEILVETPYAVRVADAPASPGGQRHATGDLGYLLPDGAIQFVGRADDQVKVRGYRVELADVQRHVAALAEVAEAVILAGPAPDGNTALIAHVRPRDAADLDEPARRRIMAALRHALPTYMVPARLFLYARLPLLPNGKIDRRALRAHETDAIPMADAPATTAPDRLLAPDERTIAAIFEKITGRPVASPQESFADLGADSLNSIQAMLRLEAVIPDLPVTWHEESIEELATRIPARGVAGPARSFLNLRPMNVDPTIPLRALAILLIVAFHYGVLHVGGGMTFLFLVFSGAAFWRFQLRTMLRGETAPLMASLVKTALLTAPIGLVYGFWNWQHGAESWYLMAAFAANFIDYAAEPVMMSGAWLWFICCFLQIYLVLILAFNVAWIRDRVARFPLRALLLVFLVFAVARFALPALFNPTGLGDIPDVSVWMYLPTAHVGTFVLGMLIEHCREKPGRLLPVVALGLIYGLGAATWFVGNNFWILATGLLLLAFVPSIRLPHVVVRMVGHVSQASLMIYLLHMPMRFVLEKVGLAGWPGVAIVAVTVTAFALQYDRMHARMVARLFGRAPGEKLSLSGAER